MSDGPRLPLIAVEILLAFGVLAWAVWELVQLKREKRKDAERARREAAAEGGLAGHPPRDG